jgi:hypothetical protein
VNFPQEHSTTHGHRLLVDDVDGEIVFLYEQMEVARLKRPADSAGWELTYPDSSYPSILVGGDSDEDRVKSALFQIGTKLVREQTEAHGGD